MTRDEQIAECRRILEAFRSGALGDTRMPEDANPGFAPEQREDRLAFFTLPMALNYQRDSFKLWEAACDTYIDPATDFVFDVQEASARTEEELRAALLAHRVALQPNKHVQTWRAIAKTVSENWGSFENFIGMAEGDFLNLKQIVQVEHKKGFPYLSGPKIFNYWAYILTTYGGIELANRDRIDIAPDTHVLKCSVRLGVLTEEEAGRLSRDQVSERWRVLLEGSGIDPIDMHSPLWFWSRGGFAEV